jgi:citrate synthase
MKFTTSITKVNQGKEIIHGVPLEKLVQEKSFAENIFFLLRGQMPNEKEAVVFNAVLSSAIDHGPGTASAMTARIVASAKNSLHVAVSAGILAMGERHGSAIEGAARFLRENAGNEKIEQMVVELKNKKVRLAGFGHAVLQRDNRTTVLLQVAKEQGFFGQHCQLAIKTEEALNKVSSKKLPLNIDGAMAAVLLDMGFSPEIMKGIFIIARVPGLVAQASEELSHDTGLKRLEEEDIEYIGK